jgi:hypothetical protein
MKRKLEPYQYEFFDGIKELLLGLLIIFIIIALIGLNNWWMANNKAPNAYCVDGYKDYEQSEKWFCHDHGGIDKSVVQPGQNPE